MKYSPRKMRPPEEGFWEKVRKSRGCWLFTDTLASNGYGGFSYGRRGNRTQIKAHRFSWEITYGPIPVSLEVLHRCDVRNCVRPTHLFLGTDLDNMQDCAKKDRIARGKKLPQSKLSIKAVKFIRAHVKNRGDASKMCRKFSVSPATIHRAIQKGSWAHVS